MGEDTPAPLIPNEELQALTARVAELERLVADLRGSRPLARTFEKPVPFPPATVQPATIAPPPPPPMPLVPRPVVKPAEKRSLEQRLGSQVFNAVGIFALIVGAAYFLKLAIDHGLIGPTARVLIGLVVGVGLVVWSERFRRKGMAAFSYSLKAVGTVILYLSLWAAFQLYHLLPAWAALVAMMLVMAWNAFMAWTQDAELLGWYALLGGFLTPILLSTGGNHEAFLFTYVAVLDLATVVLLRFKPWVRLLLPAFGLTIAFFIGWYATFFFHAPGVHGWDTTSSITASFSLLFFVIFATVSLRGWLAKDIGPENASGDSRGEAVIVSVVMTFGNATFLGCALYSVFTDSGLYTSLPWLMVGLAALLLGLMRVQRSSLAAAMQLAAAVIYLTVAVPLKASGHTLTTAWLVEGLVLYWAGTRFEREQRTSANVLWVLSAGGYLLGLASLAAHWGLDAVFSGTPPDFLSANLATSLVAVAALSGLVWLETQRVSESGTKRTGWPMFLSLVAIDGVALLLCTREFTSGGENVYRHAAFANAEFGHALVGLAILAGVTWAGYRLRKHFAAGLEAGNTAIGLAGLTFIFANLVAILIGEREIQALFRTAADDLERSLAMSGFLMAYGAGLLAVGFLRRSAFVRWQGLVLLVFTICKVFLYDISGLSAGYRVASLMGLGALLLGVSYVYQKDWLGLKVAPVALAPNDPPAPPVPADEVQP